MLCRSDQFPALATSQGPYMFQYDVVCVLWMSLRHICVTSSPYLATLKLLKIGPDSVPHLTPLSSWFHAPEKELVIIPLLLPLRGSRMSYQFSWGMWSLGLFSNVCWKHICTNVRCFVVHLSCFIFASYFVRRCALWRAPYKCRLINNNNNNNLLQFKIQGHLQKHGLKISVHQNSYRRRPSKVFNIKFGTLPFFIKIFELNCHPVYFSWWNH